MHYDLISTSARSVVEFSSVKCFLFLKKAFFFVKWYKNIHCSAQQLSHPEQLRGGLRKIEGTPLLKNSKDFINLLLIHNAHGLLWVVRLNVAPEGLLPSLQSVPYVQKYRWKLQGF